MSHINNTTKELSDKRIEFKEYASDLKNSSKSLEKD